MSYLTDNEREDSDYKDEPYYTELPGQELAQLRAWITNSEDPLPTRKDVLKKYEEIFNRPMPKGSRDPFWSHSYRPSPHENDIDICYGTRMVNGPPKREGHLMLPGYGLPLSYGLVDRNRQPFLLGLWEDWKSRTVTNREVCLLKLEEEVTNRPEWWTEVLNPETVSKLKQEALQMPWPSYQHNGEFTISMADLCFKELATKAKIYQKTSLIPIMENSACAIKTDKLLSGELIEQLKAAVGLLEDTPEKHRDWHTGSDGKVLNLVDPSLWPLVYGVSKIHPDEYISLDECLDYCGAGVVARKPTRPQLRRPVRFMREDGASDSRALSLRHQWLPCDVDLTGKRPRIESYINNLHPVQHAGLYPLIEELIEKSLPAWDIVCRSARKEFKFQRFGTFRSIIRRHCSVPGICKTKRVCLPSNRPVKALDGVEVLEMVDRTLHEEVRRLDEEWYSETHKFICPEPLEEASYPLDACHVKNEGFFNNAPKIQVIVKLANIHLTPNNPTYDGGSWHVQGQINERICATALFYYDSENITNSRLAFRTHANKDDLGEFDNFEQHEHKGIEAVFAIEAEGSRMQKIGSVLTREGRAIFSPNIYQHQVEPFELADKSRPGHCKIVALFLVDPVIAIISTGNVPPQQKHWWQNELRGSTAFRGLPNEIWDDIIERVDFPYGVEEAKRIREDLISERNDIDDYDDEEDYDDEDYTRRVKDRWGFCEN